MSYPINYPTPQGANVQIFWGGGGDQAFRHSWVKPQGASFVWFTLIGAGGSTDGSATFLRGGGSGAVTNFMGPAFLMPDSLSVSIGKGGVSGADGGNTTVFYQQKDGSGYTLLTARGGLSGNNGGSAGPASTANNFTAMGFFQSIKGQDGIDIAVTASTTTFLSGGSYSGGSVTSNYGYSTANNGFFQMQPIIVGVGGSGSGNPSRGGIGCGGGGGVANTSRGLGGDGMVVIITW